MSDPLHNCEPPVEGDTSVLGILWNCSCGKRWKLKKAIVFAPAYEPGNRQWVRSRVLNPITIRRRVYA